MSLVVDDPDVRIYHGDALEQLALMPSESVQCIVTSPPFWGLRDYGVEGQIGLEETPDEWCARLVAVMREARRVLRTDGCAWIEVGDSYASSSNGGDTRSGFNARYFGTGEPGKNEATNEQLPTMARMADGLKQKDLVGAPWALAKALRDPYYTGEIKREADRIWLAAMVDGEGHINIHRRPAGQRAYTKHRKVDGAEVEYVRQADSFQMKVEISNTNRRIMDRIVELAGGNCDTKQEAGTHGRKQTIYRWTLTADKAKAFLREIYPYLIGKQHEARLALGCPSSGQDATAAWDALKALHAGSETTVDFPAPPSLYEAGWFLRSDCIWARLPPNPMPESVTDRPTKAHSYVFLLTKSARYFYDADAIREPSTPGSIMRHGGPQEQPYAEHRSAGSIPPGHPAENSPTKHHNGASLTANGGREPGRNARSVWSIPTEPTPFAHFATFPQALVERCIKAGCPEGGTVLDPFIGSGTTALVARRLGRRAIGIELNAEYAAIASERLGQQSLLA